MRHALSWWFLAAVLWVVMGCGGGDIVPYPADAEAGAPQLEAGQVGDESSSSPDAGQGGSDASGHPDALGQGDAVVPDGQGAPGILVEPTLDLLTSESGATATFTIVLTVQPSNSVTIALDSTDPTEGVPSPDTVTFTPSNWNAAQVITVEGLDDAIADGPQSYLIVTEPAQSEDPRFQGLDADDVAVENTDDETPGITVSPGDGLSTTEAGGQTTFTVVLNSQPSAEVMIGLTSSDPTEGLVYPPSVLFTPVNWAAPQVVTVTGVDDPVADGPVQYQVQTDPASSADPGYAGLDSPDVSVTNVDDETAGVTVTPTSGLTTTEAGGQGTFTVVLNSQPVADVLLYLSSSNPAEGNVAPSSLVFKPDNWQAPQPVVVTGADDPVADGNQSFVVVVAPAVSSDKDYAGIDPADVSIVNLDDETPGFTVTPLSGLLTTEAGGQNVFTIVLNSKPSADVTLPLSTSDPGEVAVNPTMVAFTPLNWNAPQTITVTGVDDALADGNQPFTVLTGAASSADPTYDLMNPPNVVGTNVDDDTAGITVAPLTGLSTTEGGGQATFTVVLNSEPTANVTVNLASSDTTEGTVSPASLTFTPLDWKAPKAVTVTGVDDAVADGNQPYSILTSAAVSADASYSGVDPPNVALTSTDNDSAGMTVAPLSGLITTEAGGQASFTIVLNSEPTASVTISLTSSDTSEGIVSPTSVTFTPLDWKAPKVVTVIGADDAVVDANQPYSILTSPAVSADTNFNGLDPPNVALTNTDNDTAGVTVAPLLGLITTELGGQTTFTVVLNSEPTANVTVNLTSSDPSEGTVSPLSVTFTPLDWNAPKTVTVTGLDDAVADGNQPYSILTSAVVSSDAKYSGVDPPNVALTNTDNDAAGITVTPLSGLTTTEAGGQAAISIVLNSQPTASVTINLASSDPTEGTLSHASVTFTTLDWNAPKTVAATGVDDAVADGNQPYSILTSAAVSPDPGYDGINSPDPLLTNTDNDVAGITVAPLAGLTTTEAGGQATFTIVLNSQPTANVTIDLTSSDTTEGTVSPASVTFTTLDWNAPKPVTVTGADDAVADGNQPYTILTSAAASADLGYHGINPPDPALTNTDNDVAGITVAPLAGLTTTEAGGQATFTIVLNSQPTANVTINLTSSDTTEGTVSPASVSFTTLDWNAPRAVTVTGIDDAVADGNQPYSILTSAAASADLGYNGINPPDPALTNTDNDVAGITVAPLAGLTTTEAGGQATFTIVLNSQPTANVTIGFTSSDTTEGIVLPTSVTFTTLDWNAPKTVTVTGMNDAVADGNQPYTILTAAAVSTDLGYNGINPPDPALTNTDNDVAGITVAPLSGLTTTEAGGQATFTIVLNSQPTANVTIGFTSSDTTEGIVLPASVTFTTLDWNAPKTVTVTGMNDAVADGNQPYTILTAAAVSTDLGYNGIDPPDPALTNTDNDVAGITVAPLSGLTTTEAGGQATFTIVLNSQPTANVTINLTSSDTTEGTVSPASVTFTTLDWNAPKTVTVAGIDDAVADGNQPYSILTSAAASADLGYNGIDPPDPAVTNTDNDVAGITVAPLTGLTTTEAGGQDTFTIVLNSQPTANVTISFTSSDTTEGIVLPTSVTFTTLDWNAPKTVTVTGMNDAVADGNQPYTILTSAAASSDAGYNGINPPDPAVTNTDNDVAGITVTPLSGLTTTEAGGQATFTIVLNSQPTAGVKIDLTSSNTAEGTVFPVSVTLNPANWDTPQTVTITGVDDAILDGDQPYSIVTSAATSLDASYAGMDAPDVTLVNLDND